MPGILTESVEAYLESLNGHTDSVLAEMEEIAHKKNFPIVGPLVGRVLGILAASLAARRVLELGSGYGYSGIWFARSLPADGRIICTDHSSDNREQALRFFAAAGMDSKLEFHVGDALQVAREQKGPFDIVFCDIDKEQYPEAIEIAVRLLRTGGLFITDNTLWSGKVADKAVADSTTKAVRKFNETVFRRKDLMSTIIPLRDGVAVCQKR